MKLTTAVPVVVFVLFGAFSVQLKLHLLGDDDGSTAVAVGDPAPPLVLESLTGETVELSRVAGENKVVVLNFWATWCGPCKIEMPQFQRMYDEYQDRGLEILAVTREDRETVETFLNTKSYTFPVLLDPVGTVSERYGVTALPTTFLLSDEGKVTRVRRGIDALLERQIKRIMGDAPEVPDVLDVLDSLMTPPLTERDADTVGTEGTGEGGGNG
jgi:peroxiredoxin